MNQNEIVDTWTVACHEAAHALMRWRMREPATRIELNDNGGFCHGTGRRINPESKLLIALAGFAWESGLGVLCHMDFDLCRGGDWDDAREILRTSPQLCFRLAGPLPNQGTLPSEKLTLPEVVSEDIETALRRWFNQAREILKHDGDLIELIGERLEFARRLSAREVAALLRVHGKR
jgi:hypothetical protein